MINSISKVYILFFNILYNLKDAISLIFKICYNKIKIIETINQTKYIGVNSVLIIVTSGIFIGLVLCLQGYYTLSKFGAHSLLGLMVALSILRELGPVVTAMLFAGRACSSITSEIGLMKSSNQIDSLIMMNINPIKYILTTRFWACIISLPILTVIFCAVGIISGYLLSDMFLGVSYGEYWSNIQTNVAFVDIINGIIKSLIFGFLISWIALYQGYRCVANSKGIAMSTTKTVVYSCITILSSDLFLTWIMFGSL